MSKPCRFYYEDSHRKSPRRECRLIERNAASPPWEDKLCRSCPVPEILKQNPCTHLALEASVKSRWRLFRRVAIFAVCTDKLMEIDEARTCGQTCEQFEMLD